jgi:peptidoglycan hydrolase CwlO-like protein
MSAGHAVKIIVMSAMIAVGIMNAGCTKKPGKNELSKLDEAISASEGAEKKLSDLKQERMRLEEELKTKQAELKKSEEERDDLRKKAGK